MYQYWQYFNVQSLPLTVSCLVLHSWRKMDFNWQHLNTYLFRLWSSSSGETCLPFVRPNKKFNCDWRGFFNLNDVCCYQSKFHIYSKPASLGGRSCLSASLSKLRPLDLRWCEEGEGGVGEAFGVGGKMTFVTLGELGLVGLLSKPLALSSVIFTFCCGEDLLFAIRAPFLAFLNSTDVRRPTPTKGRFGGVPSGVTSWTASGWEDGVSPTSASSSPWFLLPLRDDLCRLYERPGDLRPPVMMPSTGGSRGASPGSGEDTGQVSSSTGGESSGWRSIFITE